MKRVGLRVRFDGIVVALVPDHLCRDDARLLARNLALAKIVVTTDHPNLGDNLAFWDYATECSAAASKTSHADWAAAKIEGINDGAITIPKPRPRRK